MIFLPSYNHLQPPTTTYNHLQPPTITYNHLQPPTPHILLRPSGTPLGWHIIFRYVIEVEDHGVGVGDA